VRQPTAVGMVCPVCMFVPEVDTDVGPAAPGHRRMRLETERWLEYVAHLLEHLVAPDALAAEAAERRSQEPPLAEPEWR
jgi:hypothetical protein